MATVYLGKAFSADPKAGNLAGVVFDDGLEEQQMQEIARIVGAAETAFVSPSERGSFRLRWFTPNSEVGMCVHATVATLGVLKLLPDAQRPAYITLGSEMLIETKNLDLRVQLRDASVMIEVRGYSVLDQVVEGGILEEFLGVPEGDVVRPGRVVSIHQDRELVVEVASLENLAKLTPSVAGYSELCNRLGVSGLSIFCKEVIAEGDIHTREFAPLYGYLEDPLCGTGAGAIFATLRSYGDVITSLRVEQGHFAGTSGIIEVVHGEHGTWIGGTFSLEGTRLVEV